MLKQPSYIVYPLNTLQLICNQYTNGHSIYTTPQSPEQIDFSTQKTSPIEHNSHPKENSVDSEKESVDSLSNSNSTTIEMSLTNNEQVTSLNKIINSLIKNNEHKEVISATKMKTNKQVRVLYGKTKNQKNDRSQYKIIHKCSYPGCARIFTSSGWLRAHFGEHLKELKKTKFNVLFDTLIHGNLV